MGQFGHLVQEDRSAVGLLEIALAGLGGAGEGPFLVTEELGVDRTLRNGAAVDGYVFVMLPRTKGVNHLREEFLAHAALAGHQHRQVGGSYPQGNLQRTVHRLAGADNAEALLDGNKIHHMSVSPFFFLSIASSAGRSHSAASSAPGSAVISSTSSCSCMAAMSRLAK